MARSVPVWVGATHDTQAPPRVRLRVFERCGGKCHRCGRKIGPADGWTLEHMIALANGGANSEANLDVTCDWCLPIKNAEDVAIKSKGAKIRARHLGIRHPSRLRGRGFEKAPAQHTATRPLRRAQETTE